VAILEAPFSIKSAGGRQYSTNFVSVLAKSFNIPYFRLVGRSTNDLYSTNVNSNQINMKPDLSQLLIELIKKSNNTNKPIVVYYIYNHNNGLYISEKLLDYQRSNLNFADNIFIHKLDYISDSFDMLKYLLYFYIF
jgi:hypothetical protein